MQTDFERAINRAAALGLNEKEIVAKAGLSYPTWWRAKTDKVEKKATRLRVLKKVNDAIAKLKDEQ